MIDKDSDSYRLEQHRNLHSLVHPDIRSMALANSQTQLQIAIQHLSKVLNGCRTASEQQAADAAARDWLLSIGA